MSAGRSLWIVTRKHPPAVGGMERLSYELAREIASMRAVTLVKWGHGQAWLPLFVAWAALRLAGGLCARRVSVLWLGDPMLAVLGRFAGLFGVPVMVTVHGLDITWPNAWYQAYLRGFLPRRRAAYVAISEHVRSLLVTRGVPPETITVIPVGVSLPSRAGHTETADPAQRTAEPTLLFVGRLVPRKGAAWFVAAVLPDLVERFPDLVLDVAGEGPERAALEHAAARLPGHVRVHGAVSEDMKAALLRRCDAVVMPNVPRPGDVEGFGLVALESGAAARPVFAADLEGLRDAVTPGRNGWRLPPGDAPAWTAAIAAALADRGALRAYGVRARQFVADTFAWPDLARRYSATADALAAKG